MNCPTPQSQTQAEFRLVYLACPFWHCDPLIRQVRYRAVTVAAGWYFAHGVPVFSPVTHNHQVKTSRYMVERGLDQSLWEFWEPLDCHFLRSCSSMVVLCLSGWKESVGVTAETKYMRELGRPVSLVRPEECGLLAEPPYVPEERLYWPKQVV